MSLNQIMHHPSANIHGNQIFVETFLRFPCFVAGTQKNMMKFQVVFPLSRASRIDGVNPLQVTNKYKLLKLPHPLEGNLRFFNRKQ